MSADTSSCRTFDLEFTVVTIAPVSAGKSTTAASLFAADVSEKALERTTFAPLEYCLVDPSHAQSIEQIKHSNSEFNAKFVDKLWVPADGTLKHRIRITPDLSKKIRNSNNIKYNLKLIDLPGINDAKTKANYCQYVVNIFASFDMVMFIVDANSGMNTSDEADILELIMSQMEKHKHVHMLLMLNKCDNIVEVPDCEIAPQGTKQKVDADYARIMETQVKPFVLASAARHLVDSSRIKMIFYSSMGVYVARSLKYDSDIDESLKNRFFGDQYGVRNWNKLSPASQVELMANYKKDIEAKYDDIVRDYGFARLTSAMFGFMNNEAIVQHRFGLPVFGQLMSATEMIISRFVDRTITQDQAINELVCDSDSITNIIVNFCRPNGQPIDLFHSIRKHTNQMPDFNLEPFVTRYPIKTTPLYVLFTRMMPMPSNDTEYNRTKMFLCELFFAMKQNSTAAPMNLAHGTRQQQIDIMVEFCISFVDKCSKDTIAALCAEIADLSLLLDSKYDVVYLKSLVRIIKDAKVCAKIGNSTIGGLKTRIHDRLHETINMVAFAVNGKAYLNDAHPVDSQRNAILDAYGKYIRELNYCFDTPDDTESENRYELSCSRTLAHMLMAIDKTSNNTDLIKRRNKRLLQWLVATEWVIDEDPSFAPLMTLY